MKPLKPVLIIVFLMLGAISGEAKLVIDNCILDKLPDKACYCIETSLYDVDETTGWKTLIGRSATWIGDCAGCNVIPLNKTDCPPVETNGYVIYTSPQSPVCIGELLSDDETATTFFAGIREFMNQNANKGVNSTITKKLEEGLKVYPNPANSFISLTTNFKNYKGIVWAKIYDINGREVFSMQLQNPEFTKFTVGLKDFIPGNYNVVIKDGEKNLGSQKVVIQK